MEARLDSSPRLVLQSDSSNPGSPSEWADCRSGYGAKPSLRQWRPGECWQPPQATFGCGRAERLLGTEKNRYSRGCRSRGGLATPPLPKAASYERRFSSEPRRLDTRYVWDSGTPCADHGLAHSECAFRLRPNIPLRSGLPHFVHHTANITSGRPQPGFFSVFLFRNRPMFWRIFSRL